MDTKVYELLRVAIGNREYLTRPLSAAEWETVYYICELQAVLGIAFVGIQKLPKEQMPPSELFAKWQKDAQKEKEIRERVTEICRKACETHERNGFYSCVLMPRLRPSKSPCIGGLGGAPKDVDILCWSKEKKDGKRTIVEYVNFQYVASTKHIKPKVIRHHVNFESGNIPVEVRFKSEYLNNPWYNGRFENWVKKLIDSNSMLKQGGDLHAPSDSFNVVYQLLHLYKKLFCEGIRLGHLLEYYYTLQTLSIPLHRGKCRPPQSPCVGGKVSVEGLEVRAKSGEVRDERLEIMHVIERLGMKKFAGAVMWVLEEVFDMPSDYMLCPPNEKDGQHLLKEIMIAGNFGVFDNRIKASSRDSRFGSFIRRHAQTSRFLRSYPEEAVFELPFRCWQYLWRRWNGWL